MLFVVKLDISMNCYKQKTGDKLHLHALNVC